MTSEPLILFQRLHSWAPEFQMGLSALGFWFPLEDRFSAFLVWELKVLSTSVRLCKGSDYEQCQETALKLWPR